MMSKFFACFSPMLKASKEVINSVKENPFVWGLTQSDIYVQKHQLGRVGEAHPWSRSSMSTIFILSHHVQ